MIGWEGGEIGRGREAEPFSERSYRRDLGPIGFWVGTGTLGGGDFFLGGT